MAIYFQPHDPYSSRSASLGSSIGKSLADTLNMLAQKKQQQIQTQKQAIGIATGLNAMGVPPQVAEKIAVMPPQHQEMFMKQFFGSQAFMPQQQESPLSEMLNQQTPYAQVQAPSQQEPLSGLQTPIEQQSQQAETGSLLSQLSPNTQQELQTSSLSGNLQNQPSEIQQPTGGLNPLKKSDRSYLMKKAAIEGTRDAIPNTISASIRQNTLQKKPSEQKSFQELLATPRPTAADRLKLDVLRRKEALEKKKMDFAERKFEYQKQDSIDKSTQKDYDTIKDKYKGAIENDWRLNKLEALVKKGNLDKPVTAALIKAAGLKEFGIDLSSLMTADSQEFQKISNDFIKNAKSIFGARVTEGEIRLFLQTVPNLMQTDDGKRRIIRNMKLFNQADKLRFKAMNDIVEMNGNKRPKNLMSLVEKKVKPQLDVIGKKYAEIMSYAPKTKQDRVSILRSLLDPSTDKEAFPSLSELVGGALKDTGKLLKLPLWAIKEIVSGIIG